MTILQSPDQMSELTRRLASIYHLLGHEIGSRPLVLPNGKFFPDTFNADEKSVKRVARRMKSHAGMDDIPVKVRVVGHDHPAEASAGCCAGGSCHSSAPSKSSTSGPADAHACAGDCGSGGCGNCSPGEPEEGPMPRLVDLGEGWLIQVPAQELRSDIALTTNLAKALGLVFLLENLPNGHGIEQPAEVSIEIASVALGFGALLLEGSYLYAKSCGGPRVGKVTTLDCESMAFLTALFVARGKHKAPPLKRCLSTTQSAAYREAESIVQANRSLVDTLSNSPERLLLGEFPIRTSSSLWGRIFGRKAPTHALTLSNPGDNLDIDELEALVAAQPVAGAERSPRVSDARHAELRALVDDALAQSAEEV